MSRPDGRLHRLSTGTKLLLLLTAALLPLGLVVAWATKIGIDRANQSAVDVSARKALSGARTINGLLQRNELAFKIAANGAIRPDREACAEVQEALSLTPSIEPRFSVRSQTGEIICRANDFPIRRNEITAASGQTRYWVSAPDQAVFFRIGLNGGAVTSSLTQQQLLDAVEANEPAIVKLDIIGGGALLRVVDKDDVATTELRTREYSLGSDDLKVRVVTEVPRPGWNELAALVLPLLLLVVAVVFSWYLVRRLLLLPLNRLQRVINNYQPGGSLVLPERLGSAEEIRLLGASFERAVDRIEQSEHEMAEALAGQRRLVREVHHRVKNNLQVIASMLSIHGRSADTPESRAAYAAMGRRVDALSVVHRNHFAEVEESRGIALRPMLVELAATLRASSPDPAFPPVISLEVDNLYTTQDAAVAASFFITEIVEYAMLNGKSPRIEIELKRQTELGATLTVATETLLQAEDRGQFDRVVAGLARQLRSPLEEKMGRLGVNLPIFPDAK